MELRGIGIINIKHLFGVSAVRASKSIELVIELQRWDPQEVRPAGPRRRDLHDPRARTAAPAAARRLRPQPRALIEIAARNELLKSQGYDAAKEFARRVDEEIAKNAAAEGGRR
jgi:HPr kinase/phosphorylase